jgi:hypothetical protein
MHKHNLYLLENAVIICVRRCTALYTSNLYECMYFYASEQNGCLLCKAYNGQKFYTEHLPAAAQATPALGSGLCHTTVII